MAPPIGERGNQSNQGKKPSPPKAPPPPPSPKASAWDYFNPFDALDSGYSAYFSHKQNSSESVSSSPNSTEVREREGIPDLEEETRLRSQQQHTVVVKRARNELGQTPASSAGGVKSGGFTFDITEEKSNFETLVSGSPEDVHMKKKGVTFEVDEMSKNEIESPRSSSLTASHAHGNWWDLHEVVAEIRDEFEVASSYGREVALMLEVGKLPYQPSFVKELLSRILYLIVPSMSVSHTPCNLSSTLDELYEWEKKLYKEVKDEEKLRIIYEKQCRRLRSLDQQGAESSKIDATQASIRKLLIKT
ncbi:hypothetical protein HAX54_045574 [Datura stramonium]|uniref:DUF632 domain-containing protein n=1 Tax=Datura stramonium TaxID=4076 RepID=A0ABS8SQP4_DATST|nr:hypothetical protein [Datura stramonium]